MRKINSINEIPKWFSYERYNQLSGLTKGRFLKQVYFRIASIHDFHDGVERGVPMDELFENSIVVDESMMRLEDLNDFHNMEEYDEINNGLVGCGGISPMSIGSASMIVDSGWINEHRAEFELRQEQVRTGYIDTDDLELMSDEFYAPLSLHLKKNHDETGVYSYIDLDYSDEFLIEDLKRVLPMWRKAMGEIDGGDSVKINFDVLLKKSLEYRVVQILDLKLWAMENEISVPNSVIVAAVYPLGEKGEYQLIQTVNKFIEKILSKKYTDKIQRYISLGVL